jgi:hypothetical protein
MGFIYIWDRNRKIVERVIVDFQFVPIFEFSSKFKIQERSMNTDLDNAIDAVGGNLRVNFPYGIVEYGSLLGPIPNYNGPATSSSTTIISPTTFTNTTNNTIVPPVVAPAVAPKAPARRDSIPTFKHVAPIVPVYDGPVRTKLVKAIQEVSRVNF